MVSINLPTEIGLDKYASQPPCRMRSSSPFMAKAVTATTGIDLQLGILLKPFRHFQPRNLRKLDVHQDQVGLVPAREIERLDAVAGTTVSVAMCLQQIVEELHIELIVLHDHYGL